MMNMLFLQLADAILIMSGGFVMSDILLKKIDLCGEWYLSGGNFHKIPARVPGCVHTDLLANNLIDDPYFADNEKKIMWIGETDWSYERNFTVDSSIIDSEIVILRCEGLDTLAAVYINGSKVGESDNMFRIWEFDIKKYLTGGQNHIRIVFHSTIPYIREKAEKRKLWHPGAGHHRIEDSNQIRKMQCNYGWDWGPMLVTCGIWRKIEIQAYDDVKIEDIHIIQEHMNNKVILNVSAGLSRKPLRPVGGCLIMSFQNEIVYETGWTFSEAETSISFEVPDPKLWWPNNMGPQNLYRIVFSVKGDAGVLDEVEKTIGLRTLKLVTKPDQWGESFYFEVNSVPFFAKGANWIPADTFVTRITPGFYEKLLRDAAKANMNMLRVWGGGIYESDIFYDLCDKLGICIWQDFMFACASYPAYDEEYMLSVEKEAEDNVKRIRHHACLALLCGNNEIEQIEGCITDSADEGGMTWDEYKNLFDELLPGVIKKHAPYVSYWPSSPHTPGNRNDYNNPHRGDAHLWGVWHERKPFEWYRECEHRFNSEFGFQSFPSPETVKEYTRPEDWNISSYIMEYHQRSPIGNDAIIQYMLSWFRLPPNFNMQLYLSQILQGEAMRYAVEHWRRSIPRGMGTLYWQLDDCWPGPSWSSIDYKGNWKALHYQARKFFAPVLISGVEDRKTGIVEIYLNNDYLHDISGIVSWKLYCSDGSIVADGEFPVSIKGNSVQKVNVLDLKEWLNKAGERNALLYIKFAGNDRVESDNTIIFVPPKHLELKKPEFKMKIEKENDKKFGVWISSRVPSLWVWADGPEGKVEYSDRFFHLMPGVDKYFSITTEKSRSIEQLKKELKIFSLFDTYQD